MCKFKIKFIVIIKSKNKLRSLRKNSLSLERKLKKILKVANLEAFIAAPIESLKSQTENKAK